MIKTAFKNFFQNIVYIFVPMGIVYLFLLIAVFWLLGALVGNLGAMLGDLTALVSSSAELSHASVTDFMNYAFKQISWNGYFFDTLRQILDTRWISTTLRGFFDTLSVSTEGFEENFTAIVRTFSDTMAAHISAIAAFIASGVTLANYVTRFVVRRRSAKRTIRKFIVAHTVVPLVQSLVMIASLFLLTVIKLYSLFVFLALVIISCGISLTAAWLIHGKGTISLKETLTTRNILSHIAVLGLLILADLAIALILFFINPVFALLLMIPVVLYSFVIADVNTESYVLSLAQSKKP